MDRPKPLLEVARPYQRHWERLTSEVEASQAKIGVAAVYRRRRVRSNGQAATTDSWVGMNLAYVRAAFCDTFHMGHGSHNDRDVPLPDDMTYRYCSC